MTAAGLQMFYADLNGTSANDNDSVPLCKKILTQTVGDRSVRIWDLVILIPNIVFLLFLLWCLRQSVRKLRQTGSLVYLVFYFLVLGATLVSVSRCVLSASFIGTAAGGIIDKALWLLLKFLLIASELSVLTFGLFCGKADRKSSLRRILVITAVVSIVYSTAQALLEFKFPDAHFSAEELDLFSHGGMIFWMTSSAAFVVVYTTVCLLPLTRLRESGRLPQRRSFYVYCGILAFLNVVQVVGSALILKDQLAGMCLVDMTSFVYFALFIPLVYIFFLRDYFSNHTTGLLFSYHPQQDDVGELPVPTGYPVGSMYSSESDDFLLFKDSSYDTTNLIAPDYPINEALSDRRVVLSYKDEDVVQFSSPNPQHGTQSRLSRTANVPPYINSAAAAVPPPIQDGSQLVAAGNPARRSDIT